MPKTSLLFFTMLLCMEAAMHNATAREDWTDLRGARSTVHAAAIPSRMEGATSDWPGWLPMHSMPVREMYSVQAICQPGGTLWVKTYGDEGFPHVIYRSSDNGTTWEATLTRAQNDIGCLGARGDSLAIVGMQDGKILRTTDAGATWSTVYSYPGFFNGIAFIGADTVIAHGDQDNQGFMVARSTDAGATWTRITDLPPQEQQGGYSNCVWSPCCSYGRTVWISLASNGRRILRTTDAGDSWSSWEIDLGNAPGGLGATNTLTFVDDSVGYLVPSWSPPGVDYNMFRLHKTTDGGRTWSEPIFPDPSIPDADESIASVSVLGGTDSLFVVGAQWPESRPLAYCSPDGGQSWNPAHPAGSNDLWLVAFRSSTEGFAWGRGLAYRYTPTQPQKSLLSSPFWFRDFDEVQVGLQSDSQTVSLENVGIDAITVSDIQLPSGHFTSSGVPPVPLTLQSGESASFLVAFSPQARGVLEDSVVIVSDDPEYPRRVISLYGTGYTMDPVERTTMYAVSGADKLYTVNPTTGESVEVGDLPGTTTTLAVRKKTEGLYTWVDGSLYQVGALSADVVEAMSSSITGTVRAIAFDGGDALYAGLQDGKLYKINLVTGEETLVGTATGYLITGLAHDPMDDVLWAAARRFPIGGLDFILKISTADATPTIVGNTGDNVVTNSLTFDGAGNLCGLKQKAGTDYLVQFDKATGALVDSIELGTLGFKVITMWYGVVTEIRERETVPVKFELAQNYPNPFNPGTTIEFALPHKSHVSLKVYNLLGQEVMTLLDDERTAGVHKVEFNAGRLASGVYIYRIQAGEYVAARKLILLR